MLPRFINALPTRFEVGSGPVLFNAVLIDIDTTTGRCVAHRADQRVVEERVSRDGPEPLRRARSPARLAACNRVDLHCHTDRSDGVLSPVALLRRDA